jgi:hypothetical protein
VPDDTARRLYLCERLREAKAIRDAADEFVRDLERALVSPVLPDVNTAPMEEWAAMQRRRLIHIGWELDVLAWVPREEG